VVNGFQALIQDRPRFLIDRLVGADWDSAHETEGW
jgi:hypothetical protein